MSEFWQRWFAIWAWIVVLFGLLLAGAGFAATDGAALLVFDLFGGDAGFVPDRTDRFAIGLMGAVTMGWGLTYRAAFSGIFLLAQRDAAPVWRSLTIAACIWYVVDGAISVANGFALNAVSNTLLLILFLIGVVRSGALKG